MSRKTVRVALTTAWLGLGSVCAGVAPDMQVVVPVDANRTVRIAADEFSRYHCEITGHRLPVTEKPKPSGMYVRIGFPSDDSLFDGETDAYTVKSVKDGLEIAGKNPRSVLYGVYEFFLREKDDPDKAHLFTKGSQKLQTRAMFHAGTVSWWPRTWVASFKRQCIPPFPWEAGGS